ncbi:hypothetical protein RND81_11G118400 [Saponaria officinalis]|uniref:Uncharacterized protein n=1 Tax=Saponaria officinalis TaxID=3572 RepID=A0AAW1HKY7_SAPOF
MVALSHFSGANKEIYNFSKIIIGLIIPINDWGISPFTEKTVTVRGAVVKYNYWDYIQAFNKVFFYESDKRSHTWFIKISSDVYNTDLPSWFINWWSFYGTSANILPKMLKDLFDEWRGIISYVVPTEEIIFSYSMRFFIEFSIPYIWRSCPSTDEEDELNIDISETSDDDIIKAYMDALKKTLKTKNEESDYVKSFSNSMDKGSVGDASMASNKSHISLKDLVQDAHDPNDDSQLEKIKAFLEVN